MAKDKVKNEAPATKPGTYAPDRKDNVFTPGPMNKHATAEQLEALMQRCSRNGISLRAFQEFLASRGETMMTLTIEGKMASDKWIAEQLHGAKALPGTEQ